MQARYGTGIYGSLNLARADIPGEYFMASTSPA